MRNIKFWCFMVVALLLVSGCGGGNLHEKDDEPDDGIYDAEIILPGKWSAPSSSSGTITTDNAYVAKLTRADFTFSDVNIERNYGDLTISGDLVFDVYKTSDRNNTKSVTVSLNGEKVNLSSTLTGETVEEKNTWNAGFEDTNKVRNDINSETNTTSLSQITIKGRSSITMTFDNGAIFVSFDRDINKTRLYYSAELNMTADRR